MHGSLDPHKSALKRHLDRFSHFCRIHGRDQQTHRYTDRQTWIHAERLL